MDGYGVLIMKNSMMQSGSRSQRWRVLCAAVLCAMLAGCNVGRSIIRPPTTAPAAYKESPTQFKESDGWTVAQPQDAALRGKWWEIYNEPELNALEEQLNIDNQNIQQAFRELHGGAGAGAGGAIAVFSHGQRRRLLHAVADLLQPWALATGIGHSTGGKQIAVVLSSGRSFVGARSVGKGAQHGACQPI